MKKMLLWIGISFGCFVLGLVVARAPQFNEDRRAVAENDFPSDEESYDVEPIRWIV